MKLQDYKKKICDDNNNNKSGCCDCFLNNIKPCGDFCRKENNKKYYVRKRRDKEYGKVFSKMISWTEAAIILKEYTLKRDIKKYKEFFEELDNMISIKIV